MEEEQIRILFVEDTSSDVDLMEDELQNANIDFVSETVFNRDDFLSALDSFSPDIVICDYNLPQYDGLTALNDLRDTHPEIPFILVTGVLREDMAIDLFATRANDYVMKHHLQLLGPAVQRIMEEAREIKARKEAEAELLKARDDLESQVKQRTQELEREIEERKKIEASLREAMAKIKTLSGFLPICASCKKIRDDRGDWVPIESYIKKNSDAEFTHGVCPECARKLYPKQAK